MIRRDYPFPDGKTLSLGERTLLMGILNVTPDSFYDGGRYLEPEAACKRVAELVAEGADLIDVGAESTRPGATPIDAAEEIARLAPVVKRLLRECPLPISIDTYKWETAEAMAKLGVHIINDVKGLQGDEGQMAQVVARCRLPAVIMHNAPLAGEQIASMQNFFRKSIAMAKEAGADEANIILDPGIGFQKSAEENFRVLNKLKEISRVDGKSYPLLLGVSNKSLFGALGLSRNERREATGAACVWGITQGAQILRVHDVAFMRPMALATDKIVGAS